MWFDLSGSERNFSDVFGFRPDDFFPVIFEYLEGISWWLVIVGHNYFSIMNVLINYNSQKKKEKGIELVYNKNNKMKIEDKWWLKEIRSELSVEVNNGVC